MQSTLNRIFIYSAGALLLAAAGAGFFTNWASAGFTTPHDPILMISIRNLFWIAGGAGLAVALACLFARRTALQLALILWFSMNLVIYGAGLDVMGRRVDFSGYLGNVSDVFGVSSQAADYMLKITVLYLLLGSSVLLLCPWLLARMGKAPAKTKEQIKNFCPACGAKIEFPADGIGVKIPCPRCQTGITLRKPDLLKMSCFFCREHIEFPPHAIGEKMPCPHCKMDITLKEPA